MTAENDQEIMTEKTAALFKEMFNREPDAVFFAPGRVNLIGEHTDYNGGHVFPCALTAGTYLAVGKREDGVFRFYSANLPGDGIGTCSLRNPYINGKPKDTPAGPPNWAAYPLGVIDTLRRHGYMLVDKAVNKSCSLCAEPDKETGLDMLFFGDLPAGAGLSSSASIEVVTAVALKDLYGLDYSGIQMAKYCQESENVYNGMNCGIMDQFAVAMGQEDHALFLDTATLKYEPVKLGLDGISLIITNTNKKHKLTESAYNTRREECAKALRDIQEAMRAANGAVGGVADGAADGTGPVISSLGDLTGESFARWSGAITDPVCVRRARHAVTENRRTIASYAALKNHDLAEFGRLMKEAHLSMKTDYEATCDELDILAEAAWETEGCIGSRVTGGGFGGCTVSLVRNEAVDAFIERVGTIYREKTGIEATFYQAQAGDGARRMR